MVLATTASRSSKDEQSLPANLALSSFSLGSSLGKTKGGHSAQISTRRNRPGLLVQTSSDKVCLLLDGRQLVKVFHFWPDYGADGREGPAIANVECVCIFDNSDANELFIAAAAEDCIVVWHTFTTLYIENQRWQVHSKLKVGRGKISSIDLCKDLLLVGSEHCLSLWALPSDGIRLWKRRWRLHTPRHVQQCTFSTAAEHFAMLLDNDRRVSVWNLKRGKDEHAPTRPTLSGHLLHSRDVEEFAWRGELEEAGHSEAIVTRTNDGVVRIWAPVIDEPASMRVWSAVDPGGTMSSTSHEGVSDAKSASDYFYLDASVMTAILQSSLRWLQRDLQMIDLGVGAEHYEEREVEMKRSRAKRLEHLITETPDMFALLEADGTLVIRALANFDRKPPTLCQSFTVLKMRAPQIVAEPDAIFSISMMARSTSLSSSCYDGTGVMIITLQNGDSIKLDVTPSMLFDGSGQGLASFTFQSSKPLSRNALRSSHGHDICALLSHPDRSTFCSVSSAGGAIEWKLHQNEISSPLQSTRLPRLPQGCTAMAAGREFVVWYHASHGCCVQANGDGDGQRKRLRSHTGDVSVTFLHALQVSDEGGLILGADATRAEVYLWPADSQIQGDRLEVWKAELPVKTPARMFFSVPSEESRGSEASVVRLGCIDGDGVIRIWSWSWRETGEASVESFHLAATLPVVTLAACNSESLLAIVCEDRRLRIYDTRRAFFSLQEEVMIQIDEAPVSLVWSPPSASTPSMLAVASRSRLIIFCRRKVDYIDRLVLSRRQPQWASICQVHTAELLGSPITSVCWLSDCSLVLATSNLLLRYDGHFSDGEGIDGTLQSHLMLLASKLTANRKDYDTEVILQCLLWGNVGLAGEILLHLNNAIAEIIESQPLQVQAISWEEADKIEKSWDIQAGKVSERASVQSAYDSDMKTDAGARQSEQGHLLDGVDEDDHADDRISRLQALSAKLQGQKLACFTAAEQRLTADVLQTTLLILEKRSVLDDDALRYLAAFSHGAGHDSLELDYQSFLWAFGSQKQEPLIDTVDALFDGKMNWQKARRSGVFYWMKSHESLSIQAERVARQQFSGQEERDPTSCSLLYYALGKQKLVANLWKQAYWHSDQRKMLTFLNNDFSLPRWKSAALKNAFALLSQRKFEMAASFFLLGGQLKDAVNVCVRNMGDVSLGIAIARLSEGGTSGPVLRELLRSTVLPDAVRSNDRCKAALALLMLDEKDLALSALCQPLDLSRFVQGTAKGAPSAAEEIVEDALVAAHFSRQLRDTALPASLPRDVESRLLLAARRMLSNNGLTPLALAIMKTHRLQTREAAPVQTSAPTSGPKPVTDMVGAHDTATTPQVKKVKVASLIQAAQPESTRQAEMSFDVNAFNF